MSAPMTTPFVHLHVRSAYSLGEGALPVKVLVKACVDHAMPAVAVTDTNNMFGALDFATTAAGAGVQPILGAQITLEGGGILVLLVQSDEGYRNLSRIISRTYTACGSAEDFAAPWGLVEAHAPGLICLTGGGAGPVARDILAKRDPGPRLDALQAAFGGHLYMQIERHGLPAQAACEEALLEAAYARDIPLVATNGAYFLDRAAHAAHDALLCIAGGRYITEDERRRETAEHYLKSPADMIALFADLPEAVANTAVIARRCHFLLRPIEPILPAFAPGEDEAALLRREAEKGLRWRLETFAPDADPQPYWGRLAHELKIITQMGFPGYFLIVSDFIRWAKDQGIPVGPGRGSGAGSVVAWALKITDLDPLALGLIFERFLNPERVSMPDFDIDFCQERRDEVISYVGQRYGADRVAQIITFGTLQARAVVRDVGRVLQMPYGQVDRLAKMIPSNPADPIPLAQALEADAELRAERDKDDTNKALISIALQLEGLYRHASTHAAGVVIGDRPLEELVPLYKDPRSALPATQFSMKWVEKAGLVKFDFLGLKTMTTIQKAADMAGVGDILTIPLDDADTYALLRRGETCGVFQLESAGMRDLAQKMQVSTFEHIIAAVALYRPGPMENIPRYLACMHGQEQPDYMHPALEPILRDTYGVMIYQEQVMQAAVALAGYTGGEADLLRRAMGKKIPAEMDAQRAQFVAGAAQTHEVPQARANAIFDQIAAFAGYGFNKAHSAGYALIAYWTAYLKAHHPQEFMAATMTLDAHNTDKLAVFKQELDRMGISVLPPCVNASGAFFTVEGEAVRYALSGLKGVGEGAMEALVAEREKNGPFKDLEDFVSRLDGRVLHKLQLERLVCAGALDCLTPERARLFAGIDNILRHYAALRDEREAGQVNLFAGGDANKSLAMPPLPEAEAWDTLEALGREFSAVGFYLSSHPLSGREADLKRLGVTMSADMPPGGGRLRLAGVLVKKQERVSKKSGNRYAFLQMSDPTGVYEVTLFSELLHAARSHLEGGKTLLITAEGELRDDQLRLTAQKVEPLDDAAPQAADTSPIVLRLTRAEDASNLKGALDAAGPGQRLVTLHIPLESGRVASVRLPGRWAADGAALARLVG
ncbi:MAG: DNA polymerase III subunit alpha [Alphaproteobacteria bacterium]|nr:DNA polymerase III subunit alpha [Alphaproteobacteria bacterium]